MQNGHAKHTKLTVEEFYHKRAPLVLPQTSRTCSQKPLAFHTKNTKISWIWRSIRIILSFVLVR